MTTDTASPARGAELVPTNGSRPPGPHGLAPERGHELTVGATGRDLRSPSSGPGDVAAHPDGEPRRWWRRSPHDLPDGVLSRARPDVTATVALIATAAMAEAGYNLARFVHDILGLPALLAIAFPVIAEATALSFAVQDLRDRRHGHASKAMRAATYLTLAMSSAVNGVVGYAMHGLGGLLEILPPLVLGAVIHLHGDRASRAWHSRAVLRPSWQAAQQRSAQVDSVVEVLPLLAGDDADGQATVALLRRRLHAQTLEPGEALIAAGWYDRDTRGMAPSRLRRLETVAATVWGPAGPPAAPSARRAPTGSSSGSRTGSTPRSSGGSSSRATGGSTGGSSGSGTGGSSGRPSGGSVGGSSRSLQELRSRSIEDLQAELTDAVRDGALPLDASAQAIRLSLQTSPNRARQLRGWLAASPLPAGPAVPATPADGAAAVAEPEEAR
jgi:hypothetical protein